MVEVFTRIFFPDMNLEYENDPELLAKFKPSQNGFLILADGLRTPTIRINNLGLRGKDLEEYSSRRILFLGDSFTFGSGVEEGKTFPMLIDYALGDNISVVNAGQPGYGIYQMEALFRRLAPLVRPELLIVVIWEGLFLRQPLSELERETFLKRSTKLKKLKSISVLGTHVYRMYERLLMRFGAENLVISLSERIDAGIKIQVQYRRAFDADRERLLNINTIARLHGSKLILVFWPRKGFVLGGNDAMSSELTFKLREFSVKHQIPFYSVQDTLEAYSPTVLLIPNDWHPTPLAHCLVSKKLIISLSDLGYFAIRPVHCAGEEPAR